MGSLELGFKECVSTELHRLFYVKVWVSGILKCLLAKTDSAILNSAEAGSPEGLSCIQHSFQGNWSVPDVLLESVPEKLQAQNWEAHVA